jgi:hypothetical protein
MKWTFHSGVALLLVGSGLAQAQNPAPTAGAVDTRPVAAMPPASSESYGTYPPTVLNEGCGSCGEGIGSFGPRFWGSAEYVLWWTKRTPFPVPLVTTGDPTNIHVGEIGQADTAVLVGDRDYGFGATSGAQLDLGIWLNSEHTFGVEARGFWMQERSRAFGLSSDAAGNPPITIPFFNVQTGLEDGYAVAQPAITDVNGNLLNNPFAGAVAISFTSELWGGEFNAVWMKANTGDKYFQCFAGVRYAHLIEKLNIATTSSDLVNVSIIDTTLDQFHCENNFFGGQIGAQVGWTGTCWSVLARGQVAVGDTDEKVSINGFTNQTGTLAFAPGTHVGGIFAEPSNIGSKSGNEFSVLPEFKIEFGLRLLTNLYANFGYDIMWWSNVIEPGNQIDRNINFSQNPVINPPGTLAGPANPVKMLNKTSNYMAQGLTFGLAYHY